MAIGPSLPTTDTQSVVVNLRLSDQRTGSRSERFRLALLEDQLQAVLAEQEEMFFAGHDIGEGYCALYCYGPDAAKLYAQISDTLAGYDAASGSYTELTYGSPVEPASPRQRIEFSRAV